MSELNRKLAEALGIVECYAWTRFNSQSMWKSKPCEHGEGKCYPKEYGPPKFSTEPGVFWPAFEKWLDTAGLCYESFGPIRHPQKPHLLGKFGFKIAGWDGNFYDPMFEEYGKTQLEAGCKCWLAAVEAVKA